MPYRHGKCKHQASKHEEKKLQIKDFIIRLVSTSFLPFILLFPLRLFLPLISEHIWYQSLFLYRSDSNPHIPLFLLSPSSWHVFCCRLALTRDWSFRKDLVHDASPLVPFLVTCTRLYTPLCPSVCPSVSPSHFYFLFPYVILSHFRVH